MLARLLPTALVLFATPSCGSSGTSPHDMSAARHDRAARSDEDSANAHAQKFDPVARETQKTCQRGTTALPRGSRIAPTICWRSVVNPTEQHRKDAERARSIAQEHRAASAALRGAEAKACADIAPDDRDMSPFDHVDDIASIEPLVEEARGYSRGSVTRRVTGTRVTFRAIPGLTAEWLERVTDCHLARNATLGHDVPSMQDCPLVPKGVEARVVSVRGGFAIEVRSDDSGVVEEILARAKRLAARQPSP